MEPFLFNEFREMDINFWTRVAQHIDAAEYLQLSRDSIYYRYFTEDGFIIEDVSFYGEILFCIMGLKPCVIFSGITPQCFNSYRKAVLQPFLHRLVDSDSLFVVEQIIQPIATTNYNFTNCFVLINQSNTNATRFLTFIQNANRLYVPNQTKYIKEKQIAQLLDYPVSLSEISSNSSSSSSSKLNSSTLNQNDSETMWEVGYLDISSHVKGTPRLITSFGATQTLKNEEIVNTHFEKYKNVCQPFMKMKLEKKQI